jgi:CheY-like chemotaxis protein
MPFSVSSAVIANTRTMQANRHVLLLVEDDPDQRDSLALLLEAQGYAVTSAASGRDGLEVLTSGLHPCLIVLDLMLSDMNGVDFMRQYHLASGRSAGGDCAPVILYSASTNLASHARAGGAVAHVQKPDLDRLFHFVATLC